MGEIAEMMLDGTMDPETGEWNFDGEDGPGWPMTGDDAVEYGRVMGPPRGKHYARNRRRKERKRAAKLAAKS